MDKRNDSVVKWGKSKIDSARERRETPEQGSLGGQEGMDGQCRWRPLSWPSMDSSPIVKGLRQRQEHRYRNGVGWG